MSSGEHYVSLKLVLLGDACVGKTTIKLRYTSGAPISSELLAGIIMRKCIYSKYYSIC